MTSDNSGNPFAEWARDLALWSPPPSEPASAQGQSDGWATSAKWFRAMRQNFDAQHDPFLAFLGPWLTSEAIAIDVGAGAGRLTFPIAVKVKRVFAVEPSPAMREALLEDIRSEGICNVEVVAGRWPDVAVPQADIVLCANVLYDVADLKPFLAKLDEATDRACFIYLTSTHPYASFRDLWLEFRGWAIPDRPTCEDAVRCLRQSGIEPRVEVVEPQRSANFADLEQAVAFAQRRLELPDDPRVIEQLRDYLARRGAQKGDRWLPGWGKSQGIVLWWEKA